MSKEKVHSVTPERVFQALTIICAILIMVPFGIPSLTHGIAHILSMISAVLTVICTLGAILATPKRNEES
jgi:uncharacterized membrane protein YdbT with pleckstrin-like domain